MAEETIDLSEWKQGDFFLDEISIPIIETFNETTDDDVTGIEIAGFAVVSQTCDIVRDYGQRPFVQLAAIMPAEANEIERVKKFQHPQFGFVPELAKRGFVVNFDIVLTVDKKALAECERIEGCTSAYDEGAFSFAAGRNRSRFAFPDSVSIGLSKFRTWVADKGKKNGEDGHFLSAISEIRLSVEDFDNPHSPMFLCILKPDVDEDQRKAWVGKMIPKMLDLVKEWCDTSTFLIAPSSEIILTDYLESQLLDFEALTIKKGPS